jgi:hypothetical protein
MIITFSRVLMGHASLNDSSDSSNSGAPASGVGHSARCDGFALESPKIKVRLARCAGLLQPNGAYAVLDDHSSGRYVGQPSPYQRVWKLPDNNLFKQQDFTIQVET